MAKLRAKTKWAFMRHDGRLNKLDNCNSLFYRLVSGARLHDHNITPVLHQVHWLPLRKQMDFKMATWSTVRCPAWLRFTWPGR